MTPFEPYMKEDVFSDRWFKVDEVAMIGLELVIDAMEKERFIRERLNVAQGHKSPIWIKEGWNSNLMWTIESTWRFL